MKLDRDVDDMLTATFRVSRAVVPGMRAGGWGRMVSFASRSAVAGVAGPRTTPPPRRAWSA